MLTVATFCDRRRSRTGLGLLAKTLVIIVCARSEAAPREQAWQPVCTFEAEDVSFSEVEITTPEARGEADTIHADRATLFIEQNGVRSRLRAHVAAPVDFELTTQNFGRASLSVRAGTVVGGVVKAHQSGVVRVIGVGRTGRTVDLDAGSMSVLGLPLRCDDLVAVKAIRTWQVSTASHKANGVRRIHATPGGPGFAVETRDDLPVYVDERRGDWVKIEHGGYSSGRDGFEVGAWVRGARIREGTASGGGSIGYIGFRSCAPGSPVQMALVVLDKGVTVFGGAEGDRVWATLTGTTPALVAVYPTGRAAIAGLPGWSWPRWLCEIGWVDAKTVHMNELNRDR